MTLIQPLGDKIIAKPVEPTNKQGSLIIPANYAQSLRTHFKAEVLASGPKAKDIAPVGSFVHVSETLGEKFNYEGNALISGRLRDVNGVVLTA